MARLTLVLALVTVRRGAVDAGAAPAGRSEAPAGQVTPDEDLKLRSK